MTAADDFPNPPVAATELKAELDAFTALVLTRLPAQAGGGRRLTWTVALVASSAGGVTWNGPLEA